MKGETMPTMTLPPEVEAKIEEIAPRTVEPVDAWDGLQRGAREMAEWLMEEVCRNCGVLFPDAYICPCEYPEGDWIPGVGEFPVVVTRAQYLHERSER